MSRLNSLIHQSFGVLGLEVHSKRALRAAYEKEVASRETQAWSILQRIEFRQILDIGANTGQFARIARHLWPSARIEAFEPLPHVFMALQTALSDDKAFHPHCLALGRTPGVAAMNSNEFTASSSLLDLSHLHQSEWPEANRTGSIDVPVQALDAWIAANPLTSSPVLVKIDVQGYELEVIEGGISTLTECIDWLALEVSFYQLYDGQPLFDDIYERLRSLGFAFRGHVQQFMNKQGDRILFADALFENVKRAR